MPIADFEGRAAISQTLKFVAADVADTDNEIPWDTTPSAASTVYLLDAIPEGDGQPLKVLVFAAASADEARLKALYEVIQKQMKD